MWTYLITSNLNKIKIDNSCLIHSCTKDFDQKINRQILSNKLKQKTQEEFSERLAKLLNDLYRYIDKLLN